MTDRSQLVEDLAALLRRLGMTMRGHIHSTVAAHGLTPPQAWALMALEGPCQMGALADQRGFDKSYVTGLADVLEREGLVSREPDPSDRRAKHLSLTEDGRALQERVKADALANLPIGTDLTDEELITLLGLLERALPDTND